MTAQPIALPQRPSLAIRQPEQAPPTLLEMATAAFLARYKPVTRRVYTTALRNYFMWCRNNGLDPLAAGRPHIELFSRTLEQANYARTTRAKTISAVCLFYKFAVIDGYISVDPSLNVARPKWPTDSPTLGLTHLQFEAMLHTSKDSDNLSDFALVSMLGLLGLRRAAAANARIEDLGEEHGHRVLSTLGKGDKKVLIPLAPAVARSIDRAVGDRMEGFILLNTVGKKMDGRSMTLRLRAIAKHAGVRSARMHPHMLRHTFVTTMLDAGVDLRDVQIAARHADPRTTTRYDRARENLDRHANYRLAAFMAGAT